MRLRLSNPPLRRPVHAPLRARAFTLLETALAMVIIMVGVLAMIEAQGYFIRSNSWSSHEATATYLAGEIRERMRSLPRHDPVTGIRLVDDGGTLVVEGHGRESNEVTVNDFDDVDDYDGITFGVGGNFDGPIDAFGRIIAQTDGEGNPMVGNDGRPVPLKGWSQTVLVQKINPFNFALLATDPSGLTGWMVTEPPSGSFPGRNVDQYPLRVTVSVRYQGDFDPLPETVTTMTWIVPAD